MNKFSGRTYLWLALYVGIAAALTVIILCRDQRQQEQPAPKAPIHQDSQQPTERL